MSFLSKSLLIVLLLIFLNLVIFLNRQKGFDYVKYADKKELYPTKQTKKNVKKWSEANLFDREELDKGLKILKEQIGLDTILTTRNKAIRIATWIYHTFSHSLGVPADTVKKLAPLQQFLYLQKHKDEKIWCGNFQIAFGFFSSCAGLMNRYIELVPITNQAHGYHEVNEIFLPDQNKWILVDVTRNMYLIKDSNGVFSAADYLDYRIKHPSQVAFVSKSSHSLPVDSILEGVVPADKYFNSNYVLRYYKTIDLSRAYKPIFKVKRYILGDTWYEMYDPVHHHSNFLFRVRQFFFFGLMISFFLFLISFVNNLMLKR